MTPTAAEVVTAVVSVPSIPISVPALIPFPIIPVLPSPVSRVVIMVPTSIRIASAIAPLIVVVPIRIVWQVLWG